MSIFLSNPPSPFKHLIHRRHPFATSRSCKDTFTDRRCMHTLAADIASGKAVLPPIRISRKFGHKRFRSADNRRLFLYKAMQLDIRSVPYEVIRWTEEFDNKSTLHSVQVHYRTPGGCLFTAQRPPCVLNRKVVFHHRQSLPPFVPPLSICDRSRGATAKARSSYNDAPATTHRLKPFAPPTLVRATGLRSSTHRPSLRTARRPTTAFLGRSSTCFTSLWLWSF